MSRNCIGWALSVQHLVMPTWRKSAGYLKAKTHAAKLKKGANEMIQWQSKLTIYLQIGSKYRQHYLRKYASVYIKKVILQLYKKLSNL